MHSEVKNKYEFENNFIAKFWGELCNMRLMLIRSRFVLVAVMGIWASQWLGGKEPACNAEAEGDVGSIPGSGRSPGGRQGNADQYSRLENSMDRKAWQATVHSVVKSWTQLKWLSRHAHILWSKACHVLFYVNHMLLLSVTATFLQWCLTYIHKAHCIFNY